MIPPFHGILDGRSFYGIMFVIQGDLRDQKVNLKVKCLKIYLYKCQQTSCVIPLFCLQHVQDKKEIPRSNCKKYHFNGKTSMFRSSEQNLIFNE